MMTRGRLLTSKSPKTTTRNDKMNCSKFDDANGQKQLETADQMQTPSSLLADTIAARLKLSRRKCVQEIPPQPWWVLRRKIEKAPPKRKNDKTPKTSVTLRSKSGSVGKRLRQKSATVGIAVKKRGAVTPNTTKKAQFQNENTPKMVGTKTPKVTKKACCVQIETPLTRKRAEKIGNEVLQEVDPKVLNFTAASTTHVHEQKLTTSSTFSPLALFTRTYQIRRSSVLGNGQFGTVYDGVHRQSGRSVAVKVVLKGKSAEHSANIDTLRNEFNLLQELDHPGIVKFEMMSESKEEMFAVLERMDGDMLELILSQNNGRLDERCAKLLLRQILGAVQYLHARGIAHCDLKPENILLSGANTKLPLAKLCDFGYARKIIGPQLRKSLVGTPSYLAPEVAAKSGYNKMLDIWSIGVIIYVTLSGTFPFNDAEKITEEMLRPGCLFPPNPWNQIASEALDLIQKMLKMRFEDRLTVSQCLQHNWIQNAETYSDSLRLEQRLGSRRFLTSELEDHRWAAKESQPAIGAFWAQR